MMRWFTLCCFFVSIFIVIHIGCQKSVKLKAKKFTKIVFLSDRDAPTRQFDIFVMDPDGSNQVNLTDTLQSVRSISQPVLSPDGKKILYIAFKNRQKSLQIIDIEQQAILHVTNISNDVPQASFSPKGDKILFVNKIKGRKQIYIINSDGSAEQNLSNNNSDEFDPIFSSDGSRIVFISRGQGIQSIYVMEVNGSRKKLIEHKGSCRFPVFSPDDSHIAFNAVQNKVTDIYVMQVNGEEISNVTRSKSLVEHPIFTPDGSKIIFLSDQRGMKFRDICIIDTNGKKFKNLTASLNFINQNPKITPDGKSVIFNSVKYNDSEIYKVDLDGNNLMNLTNHPKWDQSPSL